MLRCVPGVKGIGEKTALKLLQEYKTLENIYANIESIKGAVKEKLITGKESAFFSKEICTIYREVPMNVSLDEMKYLGPTEKLEEIYSELEFYSLIKTTNKKPKVVTSEYKILESISELKADIISYYIER